MSETEKRFRVMTMDELEAQHLRLLSTPDGARRFGESKYRFGYRDGYVQAINRFWELMFDEGLARRDAYDLLWRFTQTGELSRWAHVSRGTEGYLSQPDNWPPKQK